MIFHKYKQDREHEIAHKIRRLEHLLSKALGVLINLEGSYNRSTNYGI